MKNDSTFVSSLVTSNSTDGLKGAQMMDKKILIPLDGSQIAETILPLLCTMTGSVANHVLHEARTPVMVLVHPKQDVFHIEPEMMYQAVLAGQSVDGQLI